MSKFMVIIALIIVILALVCYWREVIKLKEEELEEAEFEAIREQREMHQPREQMEQEKMDKSEQKAEPKQEVETSELEPFQAGMNVLVYGHPQMKDATNLFQRLRKLGVNSIAIVFPLFQKDWQASLVESHPQLTPTLEELEGLILIAQAEGLRVMLRPILDEKSILASGHWRGEIQPRDVAAWFDSYRRLMLEYAYLAQQTNIEYFNIGTEFNSLQQYYPTEWIQIIEEIRAVYQGNLTYSFNWDRLEDIKGNPFVPLLDYIGLDAYFPLRAPDHATAPMLLEAWQEWMGKIEEIVQIKPVLITEVGMIPMTGAYRTPYAWDMANRTKDEEAQANYYLATHHFWKPMVEGIYWWSVTLPEPYPPTINYSPLRSPTASVLKELYRDGE